MYQIYSACKEAFEYFQLNNFLPKLKVEDLCSNVLKIILEEVLPKSVFFKKALGFILSI